MVRTQDRAPARELTRFLGAEAASLMAEDLGPAAHAARAEGAHPELDLRELRLREAELYAARADRVGPGEGFSGIVRTIRDRSGEPS